MKKNLIAVLVITSLSILTACGLPLRNTEVRGSGIEKEETRRVSGFSSVELSGIGTLIIEQGNKESLTIIAESNIMDYIQSDVRGSILHLGVDDFVNIQPSKDITYHLLVKDLQKIETSGFGNVEMNRLDTDHLEIEISGSGKITIKDLSTEHLIVEISGLGEVVLSGRTKDQRIQISGAGNYSAENLISNSADIEISGTGKALLWVEDSLDLELSGAGSIQYYGNPELTTEISGLGEIKPLGEK